MEYPRPTCMDIVTLLVSKLDRRAELSISQNVASELNACTGKAKASEACATAR